MSAMQTLITDPIDIWTAADTGKKSGRGRAGGDAGSVYGIKKLRELILELAVRGKLVPQDADDEPASALLKRIQAEKVKLIADGKIKKGKPLETIADTENPFVVPDSWIWVRLAELATRITDGTHHTPTYVASGIPFLSVKDMSSGVLSFDSTRFITERTHEQLIQRCNPQRGDLLLTKVGTTGIPVVVTTDKSFSIFVSVALIKAPWDLINVEYLRRLIASPFVKKQSNEGTEGIGNKNLVLRKIENFLLAIPPANEQQRIVAKVDELMALCDQLEALHTNAAESHEKLVSHLLGTLTQSQSGEDFSSNWQRIAAHFDTLFTTETSVDNLKQTLLQLAVMGKLVPQDPIDESTSEMLKRMQTEKVKLIAEGKIKKDKPLAAITEEEKPFDLPEGWEWVRLGNALDIAGGVTLGRRLTGAGLVELPYLRVANVQRGHLNLDSIKTVEIRHSELSRYQLLLDDLLVTEGGDWDKVGRTVVWNSEIDPCLHQNHIFRMRSLTKGLSSSWVEMYMNSIAKAYFQSASKQTTNLASINMTQLKHCLLAVPALEEQRRIVAKVDELMALCTQLKIRINEASQLQQKLADAMMEHAVA